MVASVLIMPIIIVSLCNALLLFFIFRHFSKSLSLIDRPKGRKRHKGDIPLIGGLMIYGACLFTYFYSGKFDHFTAVFMITGAGVVAIGVIDDAIDLKPLKKLLLLAIVVAQAPITMGLELEELKNLFGFNLSIEFGLFAIPITIISILGLMNAINMMDGCDGLAGGLATIAIACIIYLGWSSIDSAKISILVALISSVAVFLCLNLTNRISLKIFLGDSGSLFLGYVISIMLIFLAQHDENFRPTMALWIVAVPFYDFFGVVFRRLYLRKNLFVADRGHLHHFLYHKGLSQRQTTLVILIMALALVSFGMVIEETRPALSFPAFLALFILYLWTRVSLIKSTK